MPNKNYIAGRNYEYRCIKKVLKEGAEAAGRAPASKGIWDIWFEDAIGHRNEAQCKFSSKTKARISKAERFKLKRYALDHPYITVWLFMKGKGQKEVRERISMARKFNEVGYLA